MARRKRVSRRRWKARFRQGKPIPYIAIVEHGLWSTKQGRWSLAGAVINLNSYFIRKHHACIR